jgi:transcriptional regulator with XRE-family HTH domain
MISQKELGLKIKGWREGKSLSQDDLAKAIGISRVAISDVERGNRGLNAQELAQIAEYFGVSADYLLSEPMDDKKDKEPGYLDNNFKFDADKLRNAILYILEKCGGKPNIGETVLYKLLYFIDFDSFEILGRPLSGINYINMQFGPVPDQTVYLNLVSEMVEQNQLKIFWQDYFGLTQKRYVALKEHDENIFNAKELRIIDSVINRLSDMSARQIEEYVHADTPWEVTKEKEIIPYRLAYDRTAPYAHNDYDKLMQDAAGEDALKALGPMSEEEFNYYKNL